MRRGIIFISFSFFVAFLFFAHVSCAAGPTIITDGTRITSSDTWKKAESPYLVMGRIDVDSELTIEPGVVVKLEYQKGKMNIWGKLTAVGTENNRIIFTSSRDDANGGDTDHENWLPERGDWQDLNFGATKEAKLKYTTIMYGGGGRADDAVVINNTDNVSITKSEIRNNRFYGIKIINSLPTIEENTISGNYTGIISYGGAKNPVIRNNSFYGNLHYGASVMNPVSGYLMGQIDARTNWWGSSLGPKTPANPGGNGDRISANVFFDPWLKSDPNAPPEPPPGPDPVIIIPGIMGSWKKDGAWQIDPIFHTYDNLCEEFLANGYVNGENFFTFPYEWRDSNIENAKLLGVRINQIKTQTGRSKVDIVAHSMGGLLAREYIESDYYGDDVGQLITIGTPHLGAPKDYVTWEGGEFLGLWAPVLKRIVALEALENGYLDIFSYIHKLPMKSVEELLPTYNYLYDETENGNVLRDSYPANYPRNEFLEKLNSADNVELMKNVEFTKIIGNEVVNDNTVSGYNVVESNDESKWENGYPKYLGIPFLRDKGIQYDNGDETVPLYSAEAIQIPDERIIYMQSEHNKLPTDAQKEILEILTGQEPASEIRNGLIYNMLVVAVHSPVDIYIESPSHKKIGKNFETNGTFDEIEGAYYTGFDTNSEFITIPNPEDDEYKIFVQGTGEGGGYKIETTKITDNSENAEELSATIRGIAQVGGIRETKVEIAEDKIVAINIQTIRNNVEYYAKFGYIKGAEEINYYFARLGFLEKLVGRLEGDKQSKKSIEKIRDEISSHIDHLITHIQRSASIYIDQKAAEFLVEDLEDLRNILISN